MSRSANRSGGFTLLEILVALVVLGFLMTGLAQGVRFGMTAWGMQERIIERRGDLDAVDRLLRQLVQRMDPGTRRDPPSITGAASMLAFTSVLPAAAGGELADMAVGTDSRHHLVLRWTPHLHAMRAAPLPQPRVEDLLDGVERLDLAYWQAGRWGRDWTVKALPELVRFRIVFPAGDVRHWPDIVARPLRANPEH